MTEVLVVDLFVEDTGHNRFLTALVRRLAREEGRGVRVRERSARGGHGRVLSELRTAQRSLQAERPDLLLVAVDANCRGWDEVRKEVSQYVDAGYCPRQIVVCPDPHVERWFLADPPTLREVLRVEVEPPASKCERGFYKDLLRKALTDAGHTLTAGRRGVCPRDCREDGSLPGREKRRVAQALYRRPASGAEGAGLVSEQPGRVYTCVRGAAVGVSA
jgi:hypothetical protein